MTTKTLDPGCYDLADQFLSDYDDVTNEDRHKLAIEIQSCIESYLKDFDKRNDPPGPEYEHEDKLERDEWKRQ